LIFSAISASSAVRKFMNRIRTVVIPAAGFGTRWLPASKVVPKEMIPVYDRPSIQIVVEEAVASGIEHVVIVTSKGKESMASHFAPVPDLEAVLEAKNKKIPLEKVRALSTLADIDFVEQRDPKGLGHAVLCARDRVHEDYFAVMLPDDLYFGSSPAIGQLVRVHGEQGASVVAVGRYPPEILKNYGVPELGAWKDDKTVQIKDVEEKPAPERMKSDLGVVGRYVLSAGIFDVLSHTAPGALGEIQLTDGLRSLAHGGSLWAHLVTGTRYDCGNPTGMLEAALALAWQEPRNRDPIKTFVQNLLKS